MSKAVHPARIPLRGQHLIEASAGTGKTHTIGLLYLRLLLERGLGVREIAVVTFTEAATRELRGRLRARLVEAARGLASGAIVDDDLEAILAPHRANAKAAQLADERLQAALSEFDEARISTLHGLCRQLLAERAFEAGLPFIELETDAADEAVQALVRDFWRQRVVGAKRADVAGILDRFADPQELAKALLSAQVLALPDSAIDPQDSEAWQAQAQAELKSARAEWDAAQRQGQVKRALAAVQVARKEKQISSSQANALSDEHLEACAAACTSTGEALDIQSLQPLANAADPSVLSANARKAGWQPNADILAIGAIVNRLLDSERACADAAIAIFQREAIAFVREGMEQRRQRLRRFGFDDLTELLHTQLHGPEGERIAGLIAATLPALLVDEFQDTDGRQYAILKCIHGAREDALLILIGDPKQAIYRFRGGDIYTYHAAALDAGANRHTLADNWRSDARLIEALNAVFSGVDDPFLVDFIPFEPARFPKAKATSTHWLASKTPLTIWRFADRVEGDKVKPWTIADWSAQVLDACCVEIVNLLGEAQSQGGSAPSIAVLAQTNRQVNEIAARLAACNVPCDNVADSSVFASDEAAEVDCLMQALAAPGSAARIRAALATDLLGVDLAGLCKANTDNDCWAEHLQRMADIRTRWQVGGPFAAIAATVQAAAARLLRSWNGARRVTNFLHLAELIQNESMRRSSAVELSYWFAQMRRDSADRKKVNDVERLRPAESSAAVQVMTVHKCKGLQFDVVFAPFSMAGRGGGRISSSPDRAVTWHDDANLRVDIGGPGWQAHAAIEGEEQFAESLRLAYVALTRARHRLWLAWGFASTGQHVNSFSGPYAWLWMRQEGMTGPSDLAALADIPGCADVALKALVKRAKGRIRIESRHFGEVEALPRFEPAQRRMAEFAEFHGHIERGLDTYSYSRLFGGSGHGEVADHDEGIVDTPVDDADAGEDRIATKPGGTEFGTCVHKVLEIIPFASLAANASADELKRIVLDHGFDEKDVPAVANMLGTAMRCELIAGTGLRLQDLAAGEMLTELPFLFPVGRARMADLERVLSPWPAHARSREDLSRNQTSIAGLMTGSIDLVLRWQDRYYVVDYKTNGLGGRRANFAREHLPATICANHYDLQYLLYLLALHRFLKLRLGVDYDYERHVGGAIYLFLRGMREGSSDGIHLDRPPAALIEALDAWCAGVAP